MVSRMSITPTKFQEDAASAAIDAFRNGRFTYLIADEPGLGKTIVARTVIERMSAGVKNASENKIFKVYYFGSNLMLLGNTIGKLAKDTDWTIASEPNKLGMMARRALPIEKGVLIYSFSANLLGDGASSGDDKKERPYYEKLLGSANKEKLLELFPEIRTIANATSLAGRDIIAFRKFAEKYTLSFEAPDLVIFDEFHRYDDKVIYFLNILNELGKNHDFKRPPVLFLSATPYNYYPDLSEAVQLAAENESDGDDKSNQIRSFDKLLGILAPDIKMHFESYKKGGITASDFSHLLMKNCIYRNERVYDGDDKYLTLPTADDMKKYFADCINEERFVSIQSETPRYYKLCSGVYSFPIKYHNQRKQAFYEELKRPAGQLNDSFFVFDQNHKLKREGVYFDNLRFACIEHYNAKAGRDLLWVPPAKPEYQLRAKFGENANFSKLMVFSAYKMVPRIVSGVFSAYSSDDVEVETVVDLENLDEQMRKLIGDKFCVLNEYYEKEIQNNWELHSLMLALEKDVEAIFPDIDAQKKRSLVKYMIGAPYMCALRAVKDKTNSEEVAERIAKSFNKYFKKEGIKQAIAHNGITTPEELLEYCIDGGLGSVMKEYLFCGGSVEELQKALIYGEDKPTYVHVYSSDCYAESLDQPFQVKCHYAERFNSDYTDNGKSQTSADGETHFYTCHNAFNSPFWPMILCTTSANQEGYDLDRYCSRIMHYSLPPNTMSFEQRDGRIDRRLSYLARRRMVQLFGYKKCWTDLFEEMRDESGMSPYWTQKDYFSICKTRNLTPLKFERIIPYFPMTAEYILYTNLRDVKNLYRSHFGLPTESGTGVNDSKKVTPIKLNEI